MTSGHVGTILPPCQQTQSPSLLPRTSIVRVLSFDPGYKNLGTAIAEPGRLLYTTTITAGSRHAPLKMGKTIIEAIDELRLDYGPFDAVTFETPPYVRNLVTSCLIWHVMGAITGWASGQGYPIWDIRPTELKRHCCRVVGREWHNKYQPKKSEIAVAVALAFPDTPADVPRSDHADDAALVADAYFRSRQFKNSG